MRAYRADCLELASFREVLIDQLRAGMIQASCSEMAYQSSIGPFDHPAHCLLRTHCRLQRHESCSPRRDIDRHCKAISSASSCFHT
jgi:hypothetical protein